MKAPNYQFACKIQHNRLDIAIIKGMAYQVVTIKGNFQAGDLAFHFPIDSVIPDEFLDKFGIRPYYLFQKASSCQTKGHFF